MPTEFAARYARYALCLRHVLRSPCRDMLPDATRHLVILLLIRATLPAPPYGISRPTNTQMRCVYAARLFVTPDASARFAAARYLPSLLLSPPPID